VARHGKGKKGPIISAALSVLHATYIGYRVCPRMAGGQPRTYQRTAEQVWHWLFPTTIVLREKLVAGKVPSCSRSRTAGGSALRPYDLRLKLTRSGTALIHSANDLGPGCRKVGDVAMRSFCLWKWSPAVTRSRSACSKGRDGKERPVEFALKVSARDSDGYY
jgi:hypothetical protein